jgi:SAM-dependent methyltransferase
MLIHSSKPNSPKFNADRYRDARPLYPRMIFRELEHALGDTKPVFLDLACGAGQSTVSFLKLGITQSGFAIDPDPAMIDAFPKSFSEFYPKVALRVGAAEQIPIEDASIDLLLVGSAIHWFDLARARAEMERVLRPGGLLYVFEYQFPKCLNHPELAEIVRRRFNLEWKAPVQKPRGTLADLLAPFRQSPKWSLFAEIRPEWIDVLSLEAFLGHLLSQSRYLHAEAAAPDPAQYREEVATFFRPYFDEASLQFDLKPRAIGFRYEPHSCLNKE